MPGLSELSEHSTIERPNMEARDSARLRAGEVAAGNESDSQDGRRATLDVSVDPFSESNEHSTIERPNMKVRDSARFKAAQEVAEKGRERLRAYLDDTIARLEKGTPPSSELKGKIMPSIVASIKRVRCAAGHPGRPEARPGAAQGDPHVRGGPV